MRCNKRKEAAFYKKKDRTPNTNQNAYIKSHLVCAKKKPFLGKKTTPDCGALYCVHHAKVCGKPLFPLIIDLCAHSIMNAAP